MNQWSEEFNDKAQPGTFRVHVHHGKDKLKSPQDIEKYDVRLGVNYGRSINCLSSLDQVIITSYQTLTMDIPKIKKKNEDGTGKKKDKEESDIELLSSDSDTITTQRRSVYVTSFSFLFNLLLK